MSKFWVIFFTKTEVGTAFYVLKLKNRFPLIPFNDFWTFLTSSWGAGAPRNTPHRAITCYFEVATQARFHFNLFFTLWTVWIMAICFTQRHLQWKANISYLLVNFFSVILTKNANSIKRRVWNNFYFILLIVFARIIFKFYNYFCIDVFITIWLEASRLDKTYCTFFFI